MLISQLRGELAQKGREATTLAEELKQARTPPTSSSSAKLALEAAARLKRLEEELVAARASQEAAEASESAAIGRAQESLGVVTRERDALVEELSQQRGTAASLAAQLQDATTKGKSGEEATTQQLQSLRRELEALRKAKDEQGLRASGEEVRLKGEINALSSSLAKVTEERAVARAGKASAEAGAEREAAKCALTAKECGELRERVGVLEGEVHRLELERERLLAQVTLVRSEAEGGLRVALAEAASAKALGEAVEGGVRKSLEVALAASQEALGGARAEAKEARERCEREVREAKSAAAAAGEELKAAHAAALAECRAQWESRVTELRRAHAAETDEREGAADTRQEAQSSALREAQRELESVRVEAAALRAVHAEEVAGLRAAAVVEECLARGATAAAQASAAWASRELDRVGSEAREATLAAAGARESLAVEVERGRVLAGRVEEGAKEVLRLQGVVAGMGEELAQARVAGRERGEEVAALQGLVAEAKEVKARTDALAAQLAQAQGLLQEAGDKDGEILRLKREVEGLMADRVALAGAEAEGMRLAEALQQAQEQGAALLATLAVEREGGEDTEARLSRLQGEVGALASSASTAIREAMDLRQALAVEMERREEAQESWEAAMARAEGLAAKLTQRESEGAALAKRVEELTFSRGLVEEMVGDLRGRAEAGEREAAKARVRDTEATITLARLERELQAARDKGAMAELQVAHLTVALGRGGRGGGGGGARSPPSASPFRDASATSSSSGSAGLLTSSTSSSSSSPLGSRPGLSLTECEFFFPGGGGVP